MTSAEPQYRVDSNERFRGNPLIESMPEVPDRAQAFEVLAHAPLARQAGYRGGPLHRRLELLHEMQELFLPGEQHIMAMQKLMGIIRQCYSYRNPNRPEVQAALYRAGHGEHTQISRLSPSGGGSNGSVLWGVTGAGKTSFIDRFLAYLPKEPIEHRIVQNRPAVWPQIACLRIQCALTLKGTASALLRQIDEKLGTAYWSRGNSHMSKELYMGKIVQAMTIHFVGLLIVEDVQNLREMRAESSEVLEYFTNIMEESGIPVLLVSTYAARGVLLSNTKLGSKLTAKGITDFAPLGLDDEDWVPLVQQLWQFNIFSVDTPMPAELPKALHFHTMGVRRFAREMLCSAFEHAARQGLATVDQSLLDQIAGGEMLKYQAAVQILRRRHVNDCIAPDEAKRFEDVLPPDLGQAAFQASIVEREKHERNASPSDKQASKSSSKASVFPDRLATVRHSRKRSASGQRKQGRFEDQANLQEAEAVYRKLEAQRKLA